MATLLSTNEVKKEYEKMFPVFQDIIEGFFKILPGFSTQSAQSMTELYLLVIATNPSTIFELGTGHRASTLALGMAAKTLGHPVKIISLDLRPKNFSEIMDKLFSTISHRLEYICPEDVKGNALDFSIPDEWARPIFTFYDAHDSDKYKIFDYAVNAWFPKLSGQTVAIHDCSVTEKPFEITLDDHYIVEHFNGRYLSGFQEILPIAGWMNENKIDFSRPIDELGGEKSSVIYVQIPSYESEVTP